MSAFAVRRAVPDDAAVLAVLNGEVQRLHHAAQPQRYKPAQADDPALRDWFAQQLARPDCVALIADEAGAAVGYALCFIQNRPESPFTYALSRLLIDQLSVVGSHQKRGVGRLLMETAGACAKIHAIPLVMLSVIAFNNEALAFYERQGFTTNSYALELVVE